MSIIKTENICKSFGTVEVLKNVSLTVEPGEVIVIIGPSGAGKSTYLRSLNRLEKSTSGKIWIDDRLIEDRVNGHNQIKIHQKERAAILLEMGMVFQRFNLFPHKTALQNVMLAPMTVKGVPADKAREKAVQLLEQV
ncbi:MAG: ATP-binding cassette domain-containing protein, partial [Acutalibacteraceae bacterium]